MLCVINSPLGSRADWVMALPAALRHADRAHTTHLAALLRTALLPVSTLHAGGNGCDLGPGDRGWDASTALLGGPWAARPAWEMGVIESRGFRPLGGGAVCPCKALRGEQARNELSGGSKIPIVVIIHIHTSSGAAHFCPPRTACTQHVVGPHPRAPSPASSVAHSALCVFCVFVYVLKVCCSVGV